MKKKLLLLFAIASMASCSKSEVGDQLSSGKEISFSTLRDNTTRSATDNSDNYKVFAKSSLLSAAWFIEDSFVGNESPSVNQPISGAEYYWPKSGTMDFYAYAPATAAVVTNDATTGAISINYTVPANADEDLTMATPILNRNATAAGLVSLSFTHLLSKIRLYTSLSSDLIASGYEIYADKFSLKVPKSKGTILLNNDLSDWAMDADAPATYNLANYGSPCILPQSSVGVELRIEEYVINRIINDNSGNIIGRVEVASHITSPLKPYIIEAGDVPNDEFAKGKSYAISLTVNLNSRDENGDPIFGDKIDFGATFDPVWDYIEDPRIHPVPGILVLDAAGKLAVDDHNGTPLLFRGGGIIGSATGADGEQWTNAKVLFNPVPTYLPTSGFINYTDLPHLSSSPAATLPIDITSPTYHNQANVILGKGDPCQLVGLTPAEIEAKIATNTLNDYNSNWKMASYEDHIIFIGTNSNHDDYSTHWTNKEARYPGYGKHGGYFPVGKEHLMTNFLPFTGGIDGFGIYQNDVYGGFCYFHASYYDGTFASISGSSDKSFSFGPFRIASLSQNSGERRSEPVRCVKK